MKKMMKAGNLRSLKPQSNRIDFTSNDYLGLSRDISFQKATIAKWQEWSHFLITKVGSTGSRLLTGNHLFFEETEEKIARFHGFAAGTLFNCGYMANLALLSAFLNEEDTLIADLDVHASLHDGMKLSKARKFYFRHNDLDHLATRLKGKQRCYVVIESLYSMSGQTAPLFEIVELCQKHNARLIVDEAHAIGVLGPQGKGLIAHYNLQEKIFAWMGAFGKALGAHGAIVLGSPWLKKMLLNFARPLIYTTALSLPVLAAIACSYERFPAMDAERDHLQQLCKPFSSHIRPLFVPGNSQAKLMSHFLAHHGFDLRPILSPTVPKGKERLRMTLHSFNEYKDLEQCLEKISRWSSPALVQT
jgi:8-amino-7-oxononanoate synthase